MDAKFNEMMEKINGLHDNISTMIADKTAGYVEKTELEKLTTSLEELSSWKDQVAEEIKQMTSAVTAGALLEKQEFSIGEYCKSIVINHNNVKSGRHGEGVDAFKNAGFEKEVVDQYAKEQKSMVATDGTQAGYDLELLRTVSEQVTVPVVASGGAGTPEDLYQALVLGKADAVLAASIFHYGAYSIRDTKQYLATRGIPIRL